MGIFELISVIQVNNLSQPFHSLREAFGDNFLQVPQKYLENIRWNILRRSAKILPIYKKYFKTISWNFPIYITFKSILIPIPEVSGCLCVQWGWDPGGPGHYWHSWNLGRRWYVPKTPFDINFEFIPKTTEQIYRRFMKQTPGSRTYDYPEAMAWFARLVESIFTNFASIFSQCWTMDIENNVKQRVAQKTDSGVLLSSSSSLTSTRWASRLKCRRWACQDSHRSLTSWSTPRSN